ncbi:TIGR04283 family arsenosugar biosynthesis glycosyltransferase [Pseudodesulfovibrio sp. S3-i]|uniref:TIGR04283 family arsenosugar biosynthesis glycosyltransferase n=1 Tax=Pseudodesulfovibrio sp. S3-i TaxID=2929474 RepID=UPI001FB8D73E|nr:TIGR04283 family arsenosugar biosynthesis glycosyltransferase [Pseudodesulfovibrio sp. S3-i]MCJ2166313.1 TIGR04283 family arsenosugar biosynthesis glycosyltransferase [Pseudodesulfovibrio sp. S3-i]
MGLNATSEKCISVIIPVYNEAGIISDTVRHVRESIKGHSVEIVVADGGPGHATLAAVLDCDVIGVGCAPGRGVQMNAGAAMASGDILLFLHADTRLPSGWPDTVRAALTAPVAAGAFSLSIDSPRRSLAVIAYFANLRTRWQRIPYGDQALFFTAEFFRELGGFAPIPIMEDVELFRRIRNLGVPIHIVRDRVLTSPRRWERDGVLKRTLSNWRLRIRYGIGVAPEVLADEYQPHDKDA